MNKKQKRQFGWRGAHPNYCRLADEILRSGEMVLGPWAEANLLDRKDYAEWLCEAIRRSQVIVADNVAEYVYAESDQEEWKIKEEFTCVAPPFPTMWVEYNRPSSIRSEVHGAQDSTGLPEKVGAIVVVTDRDEQSAAGNDGEAIKNSLEPGYLDAVVSNWEEYGDRILAKLGIDANDGRWTAKLLEKCGEMRDVNKFMKTYGIGDAEYAVLGKLLNVWVACRAEEDTEFRSKLVAPKSRKPDEPKWVIQLALHHKWRGRVTGPVFMQRALVDDHGQILVMDSTVPKPSQAFLDGTLLGGGMTMTERDAVQSLVNIHSPMTFPVWMALMLMNCRNVETRNCEPEAKADAANVRECGEPLTRFKVLHIKPMMDLVRQAGKASGNMSPLHVCRGHFKDYRHRGLFGRHKGIYWWDAYTRGNIEKGLTFKDYSVN